MAIINLLIRDAVTSHLTKDIEIEIWKWSNKNPQLYEYKSTQLLFAVKHNPKLLTMYHAQDLVCLDDDDLLSQSQSSGPKVYTKSIPLQEFVKQIESKEDQEMSDYERQVYATTTTESCRKCKSQDVLWYQQQTRGGDEAMTAFFKCKNCGLRWKK